MRIKTYAIILGLLVFFVYSNSIFNDFTNEDEYLITDNAFIDDISNAGDLFNPRHFFHPIPIRNGARPVTVFSLMLDNHIFSGDPLGFHLTSVLIHSVNTVLVFSLFLLFKIPPGSAFALALVFGIHPLNGEAVNVPGFRADLLTSFFILSSLTVFIKFINKASLLRGVLFSLLFILGIFSKELAVMLPLVYMLYIWYEGKSSFKLNLAAASLIILSCFFLIAFWWGRYAYNMYNLFFFSIANGALPMNSLLNYFGAIFVSAFVYFRNTLFPFFLSYEYLINISALNYRYLGGVLILLAFIALLLFSSERKRRFFILFSIVFYLPASNIIPLHNTLSDRYMYIPLVGLIYIFYSLLRPLVERCIPDKTYSEGFNMRRLPAILLIVILTGVTFNRNYIFYDTLSLYADAYARVPDNSRVAYNYGAALHETGEFEKSTEVLKRLLSNTPIIYPSRVWRILGRNYFYGGNSQEALRYYRKAVMIDPTEELIEELGLFLSKFGYEG